MNGTATVIIVGNLGQPPELRHTASGKAVGNLSVAVNSGREGDQTEWIKVVVWEKTAEACDRFLASGSPVYVEGRWHTDKWTDKDGNKRQSVEVVAHKVLFIGSPGSRQDDDGPPEDHGDPNASDGSDSIIPF